MYAGIFQSPLGSLFIAEEDGFLRYILFNAPKDEQFIYKERPVLTETFRQLSEYFEKDRREFDLPLGPKGTDFQKKVWNALCSIPYGKTRSYGEIAGQIGNPKAARAVGMANHRNPLMLVVPCHRCIGAGGSLTGYAGGIEIKRRLLELERCRKNI